jgi:hypothetical protein
MPLQVELEETQDMAWRHIHFLGKRAAGRTFAALVTAIRRYAR